MNKRDGVLGKKIAILLPNPCNPDYRVIKHAETFAAAGYEVRLYCRGLPDLPAEETINGITYVRKPITAASFSAQVLDLMAKKLGFKGTSGKGKVRRVEFTNTQPRIWGALWAPIRYASYAAEIVLTLFRRTLRYLVSLLSKILIRRFFYRYQHLAFSWTFEEAIVAWKPDIIHCNDWQTLHLGTLAKIRVGSKVVFDSHELETHRNPPLPPARKRWMERYERNHFENCDLITTVCDSIAEYLKSHYNIEQPLVVENAPFKVIPAGNETVARWGRTPVTSTLRSESGFSETDFILVVVGNVTINRGIETVIDAVDKLPPNVKLTLLGKALPAFKEKVTAQINGLGIGDRIRFLQPVNPTAVVPFLQTADLGVIPLIPATLSYEYALPNKLFECAFAGLPIVASNTSEVLRVLNEYGLGETYQAGDSSALVELVMKHYRMWEATGSIRADQSAFIDTFCFEKRVQKVVDALGRL